MSPAVHRSMKHAASVLCVLAMFGAGARLGYSSPQAGKQRTWIRSGTRYSVSTLGSKPAKTLPGRFSPLCSARQARALAVMNDSLWIGTEGGLFCRPLLGDSVVAVPGPVSISVRALAVDESGALWVGCDDAVSVRSAGAWKHYTGDTNPLFGRVRFVGTGDGKLWIGTYGNGCGYVASGILTVLGRQDSLLDERVLSIDEETPYTVFFGTASGLVSADTLGWKSLRYGSRLPIGAVTSLLFDEEGNLFLSIAEQGVAIYSFGRVRVFGTGAGTPGPEVNALSLDPAGHVWAAGNSGLYRFEGADWVPYVAPGARPARHRYLSILNDEEGNRYAGTDEGTVLMVSSEDSARVAAIPQEFPENRVARVRLCGGAVWFIGGTDIYSFKGAFAKAPRPPSLYADELTDVLATETGEIWGTSRFGILHYTGRSWEVFDRRNGLPTEYFTAVSRDQQGNLWFSSFNGGVVSYSSGAWTAYGRETGLPSNDIAGLVVDGTGVPWIVTRSGVVARYAQGKWEKQALPSLGDKGADTTRTADSLIQFDPAIHFLPEEELASTASSGGSGFCLGLDKSGNCIVASPLGVCRSTAGGWQAVAFPRQMRGARPTCVIGTSRGEIWLGTAGNGLFVFRNGQWLRFGAATGLSDDYVRSLCEDQKAVVWIGTQFGGVTKFSPQNGM